jgi:hypothetical protein
MDSTLDSNPKRTFCSSKGIELLLKPVSQFKLDSLRSSAEEIPVPTYTMSVLGNDVPYPMDEEIAKNKGRLDEWNAYLKARSALERDKAKKFTDLLIWDGVEIDVPGPDSEWQKTSEIFGIKIPTDPIARKLHYVYTELLISQEDIVNLVSQILSVSQMDEEVVRKIRESFRSKKERNVDLPVRKAKGKVGK